MIRCGARQGAALLHARLSSNTHEALRKAAGSVNLECEAARYSRRDSFLYEHAVEFSASLAAESHDALSHYTLDFTNHCDPNLQARLEAIDARLRER